MNTTDTTRIDPKTYDEVEHTDERSDCCNGQVLRLIDYTTFDYTVSVYICEKCEQDIHAAPEEPFQQKVQKLWLEPYHRQAGQAVNTRGDDTESLEANVLEECKRRMPDAVRRLQKDCTDAGALDELAQLAQMVEALKDLESAQ